MDGATLHSKIYAGRGRAAAKIGQTCRVFRPLLGVGPLAQPFPDRLIPAPLDPSNVLTTLPMAFNSGDRTYLTPNEPGDPLWYADFDGTLTQPGDYLQRIADGAVWFIAGQQPLLPIIVVDCNRQVRITRSHHAAGSVGSVGYGGVAEATQSAILGSVDAMWPASVVFGGKTEKLATTPTTSKMAGWRILLPPMLPSAPMSGDYVTDDLGRRYQIDGAEGSETGWRINAQELHP